MREQASFQPGSVSPLHQHLRRTGFKSLLKKRRVNQSSSWLSLSEKRLSSRRWGPEGKKSSGVTQVLLLLPGRRQQRGVEPDESVSVMSHSSGRFTQPPDRLSWGLSPRLPWSLNSPELRLTHLSERQELKLRCRSGCFSHDDRVFPRGQNNTSLLF